MTPALGLPGRGSQQAERARQIIDEGESDLEAAKGQQPGHSGVWAEPGRGTREDGA